MKTFYVVCEQLDGYSSIPFFIGGALLVILLAVVSIAPIMSIIIFIFLHARKSKKEQYEMFMSASENNKNKLKLEESNNMYKKIARCEYCGKQARFGDGNCPNCGGSLKIIQ